MALVVAAITVLAGAAIITSLYQAAFEAHRGHLVNLVQSQAALIRAVARFDALHSGSDVPGGAVEATLLQVQEGWSGHAGFGQTGEFLVGRRVGDRIRLLGVDRHGTAFPDLPGDGAHAEPMRLALDGGSGTVIGRDFRGRQVLAAYEWVPELEAGLVAKMDLSEVRAPLWRGALLGAGFSSALILVGSLLLVRLGARKDRELRAQRSRYVALFEGSPDGQVVIAEGRIEEINARACRMLAVAREDTLGRTPVEFTESLADGPAAPARVRTLLEAVERGEQPSFEWRQRRPDGTLYDVETTLTAVATPGGRRILATLRNVTERNRERELRRRLLIVLEQTQDALGMADPEGHIFYLNGAARDLIGMGRDEDVSTLTISDLQPEPDWRDIMDMAARVGYWRGESTFIRRDGAAVVVSQLVTAHRDDRGNLAYFSTTATDISDRRRADRSIRRLATAISQITEGIVVTAPDGTIEYVNEALTRITGYDASELVGRKPSLLRSGRHDEAFYRDLWSTIGAGRIWEGHLVNRRKDGTFYEEEMIISPVFDHDGGIQSYVAVKRDVTERMLLEGQLQQAQKMEAVGQLAGGVAHDFNNILTGITGYAQLLSLRIPGERDRADLDHILELSARAAELTRQLLAFSRRQQLERTSLDLNGLVSGTLKMLRRLIPETIEVRFSPAENLRPVLADSGQLVQVIMNLAVNARDAMPEGGRLLLETANVDPSPGRTEPGAGPRVVLSVRDTGQGMDESVRERVFEPFFTTKGPGSGTGLGLATVYGIVKQHEGDIEVLSRPGEGAEFRITLPAAGEEPAAAPARPETLAEEAVHATVLVVEDERAVRDIVERTLEAAGCRVLAAGRASEARELFAGTGERIDLLLTDVVMPGGLGSDLHADLVRLDPGLKVIFMSGYPDRLALSSLPEGADYLPKPFSPGVLIQRVRRALAGKAGD